MTKTVKKQDYTGIKFGKSDLGYSFGYKFNGDNIEVAFAIKHNNDTTNDIIARNVIAGRLRKGGKNKHGTSRSFTIPLDYVRNVGEVKYSTICDVITDLAPELSAKIEELDDAAFAAEELFNVD